VGRIEGAEYDLIEKPAGTNGTERVRVFLHESHKASMQFQQVKGEAHFDLYFTMNGFYKRRK